MSSSTPSTSEPPSAPRRLALLSVSDKTGIVELGSALVAHGFTLLSTGGTRRALQAGGVPVTSVSEYTGHPEVMDGRVKTLHPRIHAGILGRRDVHADEARAHGIEWIDLVAVNLYPFEQTVTARDAALQDPPRPAAGGGAGDAPDTDEAVEQIDIDEAVEQIDIGGPSMLRSAAKNHRHVTVLTRPADYPAVIAELQQGGVRADTRLRLAVAAFQHTAAYDAVIAAWLARRAAEGGALDPTDAALPAEGALPLRRVQACRYGENPHQRAAFYAQPAVGGRSMARLRQHQGRQLSYNNIADLDAALRAVFEADDIATADHPAMPACVVVKHANPCGAAWHPGGVTRAFELALSSDPVSAFGGIVAFNRPLDADTVRAIRRSRTFFEIVAAPGFSPDALELLRPRERLRVMELPSDWAAASAASMDIKRVQGGLLLQDWDQGRVPATWRVASRVPPDDDEWTALRFAWAMTRHVKSNAIVLARAEDGGFVLNGVGAGQMSRVDSVRLALSKATRPVDGSVLASDAFFPFPDGPQAALDAGVAAMIQPGGSVRDDEVLATIDAAGARMVFTGTRHFWH